MSNEKNEKKNKKASSHEEGFLGLLILHYFLLLKWKRSILIMEDSNR